jgi:hypothetical protein
LTVSRVVFPGRRLFPDSRQLTPGRGGGQRGAPAARDNAAPRRSTPQAWPGTLPPRTKFTTRGQPQPGRCQVSDEATVSTISRSPTDPPPGPCENFLYGFKAAPRGRSRRRLGRRSCAPAQLASDAGRLARKAKQGPPKPEEVAQAAADLTREPSRRPSLGKRGQARSQPNPRTSVRATAPCQIRSVSAGLTLRCLYPHMRGSAATVKDLLTVAADP